MKTGGQTKTIGAGSFIKAFLICSLFAMSGVGYVWQKNQIHILGRKIKEAEQGLENLKRQRETLNRALLFLESPRELDQRVRELNLGLVPPAPEQIVRLSSAAPQAEKRALVAQQARRPATGGGKP